MSFIMDKAGPQRVRICFDPKERFPDKVFAVATDGYLVKWTKNGTAVEVEEDHFERVAMKCYPGFVQIPSFVNFRRLFREYSFHWSLVDEENLVYEFSHPLFLRDKPELLANIRTKRKSFSTPNNANDVGLKELSNANAGDSKLTTQTRRRQKIERRPTIAPVPCVGRITVDNSVIYSQNQDSNISSSSNLEERLHRKKEALGDMMNNFARNEMNVSEYEQYLQNQRKLQEQQFQEIQTIQSNGETVIINDSNNAARNMICRPAYNYSIEPKYIPVNFDHQGCENDSQVCSAQNDDAVSPDMYPKDEAEENMKTQDNYDCFYCDPNAVTTPTSYIQYPADGSYSESTTTNDANPCHHCAFSCSCCKHCNGCHHHSQDYTINQLGGGDTSVSYFNL